MRGRDQVLVVDDDAQGRKLLRGVLHSLGCEVREAADGLEALRAVREETPDLVLLDVLMPGLDGYAVCKLLKSDPATRLLPIVILTALDQLPDRVKARELDADEYLTKPYQLTELVARVGSLLRLKHYTDELENAANVLQSVAGLVQTRDAYVGDHCRDVARLSCEVGLRMGLDGEALGRLRLGASFHDIGKIAVQDAILRKPGALSESEREEMRRHAELGADLLKPMHTMAPILPLIRHHHERLDGGGYPDGLKGAEIPLEVRILTVVDIYMALVCARSYKPALPVAKALEILHAEALRGWWDPAVVDCLAQMTAGEGLDGGIHL